MSIKPKKKKSATFQETPSISSYSQAMHTSLVSRSTVSYKSESDSMKSAEVVTPKDKHRRRKKVKLTTRPYSQYDIDGVIMLGLSQITQKIIGCVIGDDISAENPWKSVRKELILDNIELHNESSEFLPLHKEILAYPEPELLLGWIPGRPGKDDYFYIVYTLEAKCKVLKLIEEDKAEMQRKFEMLINRPVGLWNSYGSEFEINDDFTKNLRPLYEIHLNTRYSSTDQQPRWKFRKVEDTKDGYVELLPDKRYPLEVVNKKRVDAFVQASPKIVETMSQTQKAFLVNAAVQKNYQDSIEIEDKIIETKNKFGAVEKKASKPVFKTVKMISCIDQISDALLQNRKVDIFTDDYAALQFEESARADTSGKLNMFALFGSFNRKEKYVSAVCWDPFVSGIVATGYSDVTVNLVTHQDTSDEVYGDSSLVLIWSYTDHLFAKLYLEAPRQVTALEFCPYEKNILVGGLTNGQIVIWDLNNKLDKIEKKVFFTVEQRETHARLKNLLKWFKNVYFSKLVTPTLVTNLHLSQKERITDIRWLLPGTKLNYYGNIAYCKDPTVLRKQFLTASLDGTISIWDIDLAKISLTKLTKKNKLSRLKHQRIKLTEDSKYKSLGREFKPLLNINLKKNENICPISTFIKFSGLIEYNTEEDEDPNLMVRNHYQLADTQHLFPETPFLIATATGQLGITKCETFNFDKTAAQPDKVLSKDASTTYYPSIHDGPISVCHVHPNFSNVILTIGGSIYSIYHTDIGHAILWNKAQSNCKYQSGAWSNRPSCIILIRSDGAVEFWDLLVNMTKPIRVNMRGDTLNLYGTIGPIHSRKNTFAITDYNGDLLVMHIPEIMKNLGKEELVLTKTLFDRTVARRKMLTHWMQQFGTSSSSSSYYDEPIKKYKKETLDSQIQVKVAITELEKMDKIFGVKWKNLEEQNMFKTLLDLRNLNWNQLKKQKHFFIECEQMKDRKEFQKKQDTKLAESERIFKNSKALLFPKKKLDRLRVYNVQKPLEDPDYSYIADFDEIEKRALTFIKANEYKQESNRDDILAKAKTISQNILDFNVSKRRKTKSSNISNSSI